MSKEADPYYQRQQLPNEFIEHVGFTGLSKTEEDSNRERKYSTTGADVRRMGSSTTKGFHPTADPYYGRKPVPDSMLEGVGDTGLSKEEEFLNRERKYSVTGVDVRKFGDSTKSGFHPTDDPFYGRKSVPQSGIEGVGETGMSRAEDFETRENKAALFGESSDPFQIVTGQGHRASVAGQGSAGAADARRRSSAVAPDHAAAAASATRNYNSGYAGSQPLAPIESRADEDRIRPSSELPGVTTSTTTTTSTTSGIASNHQPGPNGHTLFYDEATSDNVAPHEKR